MGISECLRRDAEGGERGRSRSPIQLHDPGLGGRQDLLDVPAGGRQTGAGMEPPPQDARSAFPTPTGLALASLVLGIAALGLSFVLLGILIGAVGAALGIAYLMKKRGPTAMARCGVILSILGMIASIGFAALYYHYFYAFFRQQLAGAGSMWLPPARWPIRPC
jgi:hypothetical protein